MTNLLERKSQKNHPKPDGKYKAISDAKASNRGRLPP